jgi:small-conductance mechanosensitive channel
MKKLIAYTLLVISFSFFNALAQEAEKNDSVAEGLKYQAEADFLFQQQVLDSLIKLRLISDLQEASGNNRKTRELEKKLKKIETEDSLRKLELIAKLETLRQNTKGSPVVPFTDTLFLIYSKIASYTPEDRASNITKRILKVYDDPFFKPDSIYLIQTEAGTEIIYESELVIMAVSKIDGMLYNKDDNQLAKEYLMIIRKSIVDERQANSLTNWMVRIGKVALIILGLSLLIYLINKLFGQINKSITSKRDRYRNGITINKIRLFSPEHLELFILRVSGLLQIFLMLLAVYLSLPLLFSIFPETRAWTATLLNWVLSPAREAVKGVIAFLPDLFSILVIYFIFKYTIRGIKYFVNQIEKGDIQINGFHADWAQPTFRILKFLLYAFMLVLIFPYLPGSGSPAFQGISVFIGVLFSLGSSSAIANMVAGMVITYMRPFKIGDRVKIGEITGDVMEKNMLVTRIRTVKNEDITVPNSTVLLNSTTNYSTNTSDNNNGLIIHTTVTIGYDAPWKDVHQALIDAALRTELILKKPQPFVLQTSLDDFYVSYQINGYTKEANNQARLYSQLHQNIQDCFNEAGLEIMSPHYRAQRDGNLTTIPGDYLEKNYEAPAFRIKEIKDKT